MMNMFGGRAGGVGTSNSKQFTGGYS